MADHARQERHRLMPGSHQADVEWIGGIPEDSHTGDRGEHILEELQLFPDDFGIQ